MEVNTISKRGFSPLSGFSSLLPLWHSLFSSGETVCSSLLSPALALLQITILTTYIISYMSMAISSCPQQKASAPLLTIFHRCIDRYRMTKAYEIMNNAMKAPWIFPILPIVQDKNEETFHEIRKAAKADTD